MIDIETALALTSAYYDDGMDSEEDYMPVYDMDGVEYAAHTLEFEVRDFAPVDFYISHHNW